MKPVLGESTENVAGMAKMLPAATKTHVLTQSGFHLAR